MEDWTALLVDDEEEFVTTLAERLELRGIKTLTATDGQEALGLIEAHRPPVVVLDLLMPGVSGLDILRHIKDNYTGIEVILLTGHGATREGIESMKLGSFDFLMKPVKIEELIPRMIEARRKAAAARPRS
jgi:DNA-binding NtrC family response regulator